MYHPGCYTSLAPEKEEFLTSVLDKFKGSLVGCAVGDALGTPVRGMDARSIAGAHGRVDGFTEGCFGAGRITGVTQMAVVLTQALLEAGRYKRAHVAMKFGRWMEASDSGGKEARGACAATVESTRGLAGGVDPSGSGVDSAGCGAATRAAPIGLRYFHDPSGLHDAAADQARLTHTDPAAVAGSVAVAMFVAAGISDDGELEGAGLVQAVAGAVHKLSPEFAARLAGLADYLDAAPEEGFAYTGSGGVVTEAVPAALFAFLRAPYDFEECVLTAVNAGGDTGSTGAIAGAVSGSFNGESDIPERFSSHVEGGSYVSGLAYRLFTLTPACTATNRPVL